MNQNIIDKEWSWKYQKKIKLDAEEETVSLGRQDYSSGMGRAKRRLVKTQICPSEGEDAKQHMSDASQPQPIINCNYMRVKDSYLRFMYKNKQG